MRECFLFIAICMFSQCRAQNIETNCPKVFYHSTNIHFDSCRDEIKRVGHNIFKKKISIKYENGEKQFVPLDTLWGLQRKNENPTRLIDGDEYEIKFYSPIIIYAQHHFKGSNYYFSKTLDSSLYSFTEKNLKKQVDQQTYEKILSNKKMKRNLR